VLDRVNTNRLSIFVDCTIRAVASVATKSLKMIPALLPQARGNYMMQKVLQMENRLFFTHNAMRHLPNVHRTCASLSMKISI
jgi:hypothetical protein